MCRTGAPLPGISLYARTTISTGCRNLIRFWKRSGRLFLALRLPFEPLPHQRLCSRPLPAPPVHFVPHLLPVPLLWLLARLPPLCAVPLPLLAVDRLPHWRVCPGLLLLTPLRSEHPLSPVRVLSAWNPLPYSGAPYSKDRKSTRLNSSHLG